MDDYNKTLYSITCYDIIVSERKKSPRGKKAEDLTDLTRFLNYEVFLDNFFGYVSKTNYDTEKRHFKVESKTKLDDVLSLKTEKIQLDFGLSGTRFKAKTVTEELDFDEKSKLIRIYTLYFFVKEKRLLMVMLRKGKSSCKTAVINEMSNFIKNSNLVISTNRIANEKFVEESIDKSIIESISFSSIFEIDRGDMSEEVEYKEKISRTSTIGDLETKKKGSLFSFLSKLIGIREELVSTIEHNFIAEGEEVEENSIKLLLSINGVKRTVPLADVMNMLFDIDITDRLSYDIEGNPSETSIDSVVRDYVSGIHGIC
ncbi:MAG: hypothetical protein V3574_04125 [Candidatus Moraniibacteriota bacterium]